MKLTSSICCLLLLCSAGTTAAQNLNEYTCFNFRPLYTPAMERLGDAPAPLPQKFSSASFGACVGFGALGGLIGGVVASGLAASNRGDGDAVFLRSAIIGMLVGAAGGALVGSGGSSLPQGRIYRAG
jgi:hypothetical protein